MSRIIIGQTAAGKSIHMDLDVLLRTRLLIQANSGGGKSWAIRRIVEQSFGKIQIIIIDPEGEFATLREKYGFVLAGKGGDTPADIRSAELLAQRLLELRASCVCDIFEMKPFDRHRWVKLFLDSMLNASKKLWHPVLVIVDEAHKYAPEKGAGESEASESMVGLCTTGRKRGFCAVFATQRLGKLRKDASAELLNRLVGPTFEDVDRKRAADLLGILKSDEKEFFHQIQMLEPGNFFALGRAISTERLLVKIGAVTTTHPEVGAKYSDVPPPPTDQVVAMLPQLADLPKQAEDRARTVTEMQTEIRSLKQQLRQQPTEHKTIEKIVRVPDPEAVKLALYERDQEWITMVTEFRKKSTETLDKMVFTAPRSPKRVNSALAIKTAAGVVLEPVTTSTPVNRVVGARRKDTSWEDLGKQLSSNNGNSKLRDGAERMLSALCQFHPGGMPDGRLRSHAGLKKSGTYSAYKSDLFRGGYIEKRGADLFATQTGIDYFGGNIPDAPQSTEDVLAIWNSKLRDGARRMLDRLVAHGGEMVPREQLFEESNLEKSGTASAYLSDLKRAQLALTSREGVAANRETLFL
jgi:hypothetical protein